MLFQDQLEKKDAKLQKVQKELTEAMETRKTLEGDLDQKGRAIRELEVCSMLSIDVHYSCGLMIDVLMQLHVKCLCLSYAIQGECDKLNYQIQELESTLGEKTEHINKLEGQCSKDAVLRQQAQVPPSHINIYMSLICVCT